MRYLLPILLMLFIACEDNTTGLDPVPPPKGPTFIKAVDFSGLPEVEQHGISFLDSAGVAKDPLVILKENGINTIRLRLWHTPDSTFSSFDEVRVFADRIRAQEMDVWITVHYSDSWADPGQQVMPDAWLALNFDELRDSVYNYTEKILRQIQPNIIQIGNEINSGFLHPFGEITSNPVAMDSLIKAGIQAVRDTDSETKVMLHYAGYVGAEWFFQRFPNDLDYDMIGLSYYPLWHGKDLPYLRNTLSNLRITHNKDVMIVETSYPFTLGWADYTGNIVGSNDQILDQFEPTFQGQKEFMEYLFAMSDSVEAVGVAYYGAEQVAFDGPLSESGSYWENQALFDFEFKAVPALGVFRNN